MKKGRSLEKVKKPEEKKNNSSKKFQEKKKNSPEPNTNQTKINKADNFPKNVNEFRHIMDDVNCCVADIEYMLELRRHKKISNLEKNIAPGGPAFYDDDLQKYKKKISQKSEEKKFLQTNIGKFRQMFGDRSKYAMNDSNYKFQVTLRTDYAPGSKSLSVNPKFKDNVIKNRTPWNSTIIPKEKSLFDTLLPPVITRNKEIFSKCETKISRPIIRVNKEGYINGGIINGEKIKGRVFDYSNSLALRFPSDHFPSSKYINDYGIQNIGAIRHLLNDDNRTMTSAWSTYLRGEKKKKFLPEETKQREKRLKDRSAEKTYPKA